MTDVLARTKRLGGDLVDGGDEVVRARRAGPQTPRAAAGVTDDRRKRLIQLVSQPSCHLAQRGDPERVSQRSLVLARELVGPFALGHVLSGPQHLARVAVLITGKDDVPAMDPPPGSRSGPHPEPRPP